MAASVLEVTRDILIAYIEKYPLGSSAYSANIEAAMERLRADVIAFAKELYHELNRLETETISLPLPEEEADDEIS